MNELENAVVALNRNLLIAYPTEAVFGLGCNPDSFAAVSALLELKQRPVEKGLILVAATVEQLEKYVDFAALSPVQKDEVFDSWPGEFTWVLPVKSSTPKWLTGEFSSIAARVSAHPQIQQICQKYGKPIVSTSANLAGELPCRSADEVVKKLPQLAAIVGGSCNLDANPTQIKNALTGEIIRAG